MHLAESAQGATRRICWYACCSRASVRYPPGVIMSALMKSASASCLVLFACLGTSMLAQSGLIFQDGWEAGVGTGCDQAKITDNGAWNDYGPSSTCSNPPVAEVVNNEHFEGSSS